MFLCDKFCARAANLEFVTWDVMKQNKRIYRHYMVSHGLATDNGNKFISFKIHFSLAFALERKQSNSNSHLCDNVTWHIYFGGLAQYQMKRKINQYFTLWGAVTTKIQGCQINQQIQRWCKDQLQDSVANKGMAWPNYRQSSFPSWNRTP